MIKTLDLNGTWKARWTDGIRGRMQGEGLREYCENFRRRMFQQRCRGFLDVQRLLAGDA